LGLRADLNGEGFFEAMFEIADIWTESTAVYEYVEFLVKLFRRISRKVSSRDAIPGAVQ